MAEKRNNFYEEIIKNNYYEEKVAQDQELDLNSMLDAFSTDEMEALAEELNIAYEKRANGEATIEDQVDKEEKMDKIDEKNEEKAEGGQGATDERVDTTESEQTEENKTKSEKEEIVNDQAKEVEVTAGDCDEDELIKIAYEVAEEKLASAGLNLIDYVYNTIPNEKVASFIAENSEKLAYLSGKSSLQVADDIMLNMNDILESTMY